MKKSIFIILAAASMLLSSCITATILHSKDANEEAQEISNGTIFQIEKGTVTYDNGVTFAFRDFGRMQYIKDGRITTILTPTDSISINTQFENYTITPWEREGNYDSQYVFRLRQYELDGWVETVVGDESKTTKTVTIAGKSCQCVIIDSGEFAGYKRVLMRYRENNGKKFEAKSFSSDADEKLFKVPEDYRKK